MCPLLGSKRIPEVKDHYVSFRPKTELNYEFVASDIRLKKDIVKVEHLQHGLNLYRYRYKRSNRLYVGVMAQEVTKVEPDAVVRGPDGYLRVNYARLGINLQTWDEWRRSHEMEKAHLH
jgi:hypothetical protein